jgi:histidinol-phosphate aminotransferase
LKKNLIHLRFRKESPNPKKYLRLHRSEFGSDFKKKIINLDSFYPESTKLIKKLSEFHKVKQNNIIIGLGAESLIKDVFLWFSKKSKSQKVLNIIPNYYMYTFFSKVFDIREYNLDYNPLKEEITSKLIIKVLKKKNIKLLILTNPSSPFEKNWSINEILKVLNFCKKNRITVLLDEVYQLMGAKSCIAYLKKYSNLIILRSFSKAFGYPGIRSGYVLANVNLVKEIETYRLAIELPSDTIQKSINLIDNFKTIVKKKIKSINIARKFAHDQFKKRGIKSFNNFSNSVSFLFSSDKIKNRVCEKLKKNKILVNYNYPKQLSCFANITTTNKRNVAFFFKKLDFFMKNES